ncbi:hypothetical protein [Pseudomonas amygdali]|uniref:Methyl-accepting chemotaxis protein n=2 Tax=Pseudomonas amygdali pv. lachrymans TaxID=53707 RepID=A0ABR5KU40_PSEAV|nr:hypothetical protein [Pseudomonas amygdali]AXH59644.1 hypothetical protein PLA107_030945 [Pseudomonas amygdali pv. lachrymans str. M301315]KPC17072.1 Uncharacterized protein AC499_0274 [Pseudomonas amygdali pv. lachrymans]KPC18031.1 Uncharacterized protein AC499_1233 [Pseudomonas amygdali pv. lachrymans]RMT05825.1 hypothetical protein ALP54_06393 [Pseudomonas amygdali pv. lachrymans]
MSIAPAIEQSPQRQQFVENLGRLYDECRTLSRTLGIDTQSIHSQYNSNALALLAEFVNQVNLAQAMILESKSLFGTARDMEIYLVNNMAGNGKAHVVRVHFSVASSYALQLEGEHHAEVARYLKDWYQRSSDQAASLPNVRALAQRVSGCFGDSLEEYKPGLFKQAEFGDVYIQTSLFASEANQRINLIVAECMESDDRTRFWIEKLRETQALHPEDFDRLKTLITTRLLNADINGLARIREFILGSASATGHECSNRMEGLVKGILDREHTDEMVDNQLQVITSNAQYIEDVMMEDLLGTINELQIHYRDNDRGDEFNLRDKTIPQLTRSFQALGLSDLQLAVVGMRVVANFSRGQTRDTQNETLETQFKAISEAVFREGSYIRDGSLQYSVMLALVKCLPTPLLAPMAEINDKARAAIYKATGNGEFLKGIKDGQTIDSLIGHDLGL